MFPGALFADYTIHSNVLGVPTITVHNTKKGALLSEVLSQNYCIKSSFKIALLIN